MDRPYTEIRARLEVLPTSPQPTVEATKTSERDPETLIHSADLPMLRHEMTLADFQDRLGGGGTWSGEE